MSENTVTCSECGHEQAYDPEQMAGQQSDPEVARLILDGTLTICRCDQCGAETGVYFQPLSLRAGHIGWITCFPPSRIENVAFIKETARYKANKILDSIHWVFSLDELCHQAKLWTKIEELQLAENRDAFESKYGG